jgi:iron-sulfur cluster repair protein YtfE (RIC family)
MTASHAKKGERATERVSGSSSRMEISAAPGIEGMLDRLHEVALAVGEPDARSDSFRRCLSELGELDRLLRQHHRLENEVLFPRGLEIERQLL